MLKSLLLGCEARSVKYEQPAPGVGAAKEAVAAMAMLRARMAVNFILYQVIRKGGMVSCTRKICRTR